MPRDGSLAGGMIDLHCHVLPGIDDGAGDLETAVAMCRRAAEEGCDRLVATPHLRHRRWPNVDRAQLERLCEELRRELPEGPQVLVGGEIAVHSASVDEIFNLPDGAPHPFGLAGSRHLLLELDWEGLGPDPVELVYELKVAGWFPIIAHPERVPWLVARPSLMKALVDHGAALQLTAMSLTGELGRKAQICSEALLDEDLVHFVASDAHDLQARPPGLRAAWSRVRQGWGRDRADRLFFTHPRAVLEDRPLPADRPELSAAPPV